MAIKLTVVVLYMLVLILIGAIASRRMKNVRDYFAAGKSLNFWAVAFSARATGESAWLLLGLTGLVAAFSLVIFVTIYVSAQIDATGKAFNGFLGWNYYAGVFTGFGVVLVYIVSGGFLAVVGSDVFQGSLMFLGLVALPIVGIAAAGGWGPIAEGLRAQDPGLLTPWGPDGFSGMALLTAGGLAMIGLGFLGSPQIFVRFLALRSEKEIGRGAAVALTWTLLADSGAVLTGMVGRHLYVSRGDVVTEVLKSGGEGVLPMLVDGLLPTVFVGLAIAVVLSAIMSTVDSLLVVASSAFVRDYYQKVRHPELPDDQLVGLSRKTTFALAIAALLIALTVAVLSPNRTVFWFVIFGWSGIAATFCPTIILSLCWRGLTARGAMAAMITGFVSVPLFKFLAPEVPGIGRGLAALEELPPSFAMGFLAAVIVGLTDRRGRERIAAQVTEDLEEAGRA